MSKRSSLSCFPLSLNDTSQAKLLEAECVHAVRFLLSLWAKWHAIFYLDTHTRTHTDLLHLQSTGHLIILFWSNPPRLASFLPKTQTDRKTTQRPGGSQPSLTVTPNLCCSLIPAWSISIWESSHSHFNRPPRDSRAVEEHLPGNSFWIAVCWYKLR